MLAPLGALYGFSVALKARFARPFDPGLPVICVGNLTAGGSGKTPIAIAIAERLRAKGHKPFFLTRGYGGTERGPAMASRAHSAAQMGDEALLLARAAPTIVARDRAAGARLAREKGATVLVMDDGHQNFSLTKSLSLVVVDAETGFGNGFQIPAGPLRETVAQGLARADAVVLMGGRHAGSWQFFRSRSARASEGGWRGLRRQTRLRLCRHRAAGEIRRLAGRQRGRRWWEAASSTIIIRIRKKTSTSSRPSPASTSWSPPKRTLCGCTVAQREGIRMLKAQALFDDPAALDRLLDTALAAR